MIKNSGNLDSMHKSNLWLDSFNLRCDRQDDDCRYIIQIKSHSG